MTIHNSNTKHEKFKHLNEDDIEAIIAQINAFLVSNKNKKRNIGKTQFMSALASSFNMNRSTLYKLLQQAHTTTVDTHLHFHVEYSSSAAIGRRAISRSNSRNNSKYEKALPFIELISNEVLSNKYSSIDETINKYTRHHQDIIQGMTTVCTKSFYKYVKQGKLRVKPIDLPRMVGRRVKNYKTYIPKRQRGVCITNRPVEVEQRDIMGHWEGDLVVGPRDGKNGALLTLIERKTRFYYTIPIKNKSSKAVYMAINKLNKLFDDDFSGIFKSITFDNGSEFARYLDIEKKPYSTNKRTEVYFARPYRSSDRGSNENCNGLVRYTIKKGTHIETYTKDKIKIMNKQINEKHRKIHDYRTAIDLFNNEVMQITGKQFDLYSIY